jgi:hypothetical protein
MRKEFPGVIEGRKHFTGTDTSDKTEPQHGPHHVIGTFYNHVNRIDPQSSRAGGFKLRKKATQASLFNENLARELSFSSVFRRSIIPLFWLALLSIDTMIAD